MAAAAAAGGAVTGTLLVTAAALMAALTAVDLTTACFITNCPLGGKRALGSAPAPAPVPQQMLQQRIAPSAPQHQLRQCMSCGPEGLGQCYGPDICCGETIGCFIRTAESRACAHENEVPVPCDVRGRPCGGGGQQNGRCATDEVCCNDKYCQMDSSCKESKEERQKALNDAFLAVIKDMISHKSPRPAAVGSATGGGGQREQLQLPQQLPRQQQALA